MNALVTIDRILSPEDAGVVLTAAVVFAPKGVETVLSKLEAEVRATPQDMTTDEGREAIKALAYKVSRSKTALDEMGKELGAENYKAWKAITAERSVICERLDALRDEVRGPLTAWETAETARVDGHERAIVRIVEMARFSVPPRAGEIRACIIEVQRIAARGWDEFHERAEAAATDALALLETMLATAEQAERDAAELAELRKLKAEREERDAQDARQRAINEQMQKAAEETAERERVRIEQQAERDRQQAEQAEREKIEAAARAVEQERERAARVKADEDRATAKREANGRHRAKVHKAAMDALVAAGLSGPEANDLIGMIIDGKIPHVSIQY